MSLHSELQIADQERTPALRKDWRFYTGLAALLGSCVLPAVGLLVPLLGLPVGMTTGLVAVFVVGAPEVLLLLAAVLLGKEALQFFLHKAKRAIGAVVRVEWASKRP